MNEEKIIIKYVEMLTRCPKCQKSYSQMEDSKCPHKFLDKMSWQLTGRDGEEMTEDRNTYRDISGYGDGPNVPHLSKPPSEMTDEELREQVKLKDDELSEIWTYFEAADSNDGSWYYRLKTLKKIQDKILEKTIPRIRKAEREMIITKLNNNFSLAPNDDSYLRILVKSTLDFLKTGKRIKERQALKETNDGTTD